MKKQLFNFTDTNRDLNKSKFYSKNEGLFNVGCVKRRIDVNN